MENEPMKQAEIDAIKARLEKATPGPWVLYRPNWRGAGEWPDTVSLQRKPDVAALLDVEPDLIEGLKCGDAEFIAAAPTDISRLLEDNKRLRGLLERVVRNFDGRDLALMDSGLEDHGLLKRIREALGGDDG